MAIGGASSLNPFGSMGSSVGTKDVQSLAADANSLASLKLAAGKDSPDAIKKAAKEFESLFMRELLKSMRQATMKSGLMDESGEGNLGQDLMDQQFAVQMSGQPGGLSEIIAKQLQQQMSNSVTPTVSMSNVKNPLVGSASGNQADFVAQHTNAAARVAASTGIPASYMIGQAAHETGWGKSEIKNSDGSSSHNLFGIKAGAGWTGKTAEITTTEYIDGEPKKVTAKFRAYDSYEQSFRDYARLINENPRYAQARSSTGSATAYATALQNAGYATDPAYASKLSRVIQMTQNTQVAQAGQAGQYLNANTTSTLNFRRAQS